MKLADLLQLLYTAHRQYASIQVSWHYWYRVDAMNEILEKWTAQQSPGSVKELRSTRSVPNQRSIPKQTEMAVQWHVWWQKPSCWRDETQTSGHGTSTRVICEHRWSFYSAANNNSKLYTNTMPEGQIPKRYVRKSQHRPGGHLPQVEDVVNEVPLLDPSFLLASHDLEPIASTTHAEREAVQVKSVFRKGKDLARDPGFWGGADEHELLVDKERGILLRYAARLRGQEIAVASVEHVTFDEVIPDDVFVFTPPPNTSVELVS